MSIFRRVRVISTPNELYHGHEGDLIRYLSDLDGTLIAEIRWDEPWPTGHMSRQNVEVKYLVAVDGEPLDPSHLIQEEV